MRLGLTSAAFYGRMETEDAAGFLTQLDIDCCEVFLESLSEYCGEFGCIVRERLGDLPCVTVHSQSAQFEPDLFGRSPRQRADAMRFLTGAMDAGHAFGARYYVLHGACSVIGRVTMDRIFQLEERFAEMKAAAQARELEILWENVSYGAVSSVDDFRRMMQRLPGLHFVLDVKQSWRGGIDPFEVVREVGEHIRHVHIMDHDEFGRLCLPGEGVFDIDRLLRMLRDTGYTGDIIIEPYANHTEDTDALRRSIDHMHNLLARIGG